MTSLLAYLIGRTPLPTIAFGNFLAYPTLPPKATSFMDSSLCRHQSYVLQLLFQNIWWAASLLPPH